MAPRKTKQKTPRKRKRRVAVQSAASEDDVLRSRRAISLSRAFDYLEERTPGMGVRRPPGASRRTVEAPNTARTATIHIDPEGAVLSAVQKRFTKAWKTGKYVGEHFGFRSPAALRRAITPGQWGLLARLQHIGPTEIPALARALNRDTNRVREDVAELIRIGLIERTTQDTVWVPFREIRTTFVLRR